MVAILRPARTPKGTEVRTVIKHVTKRLRKHWPNTRIVWRGDSHYGRVEAMEWIEENDGDYIFGLPGNSTLDALAAEHGHHPQHFALETQRLAGERLDLLQVRPLALQQPICAAALQQQFALFPSKWMHRGLAPVMKSAMNLIGVPAGEPYPPYSSLTPDETDALAALLKTTVLAKRRFVQAAE